MMPIAALMIERRLIERMISQMDHEVRRVQRGGRLNSGLIDTAARFIRLYADQRRQDKEEYILFRELGGRAISAEHNQVLDELVQEHQWSAQAAKTLSESNNRYKRGDVEAVSSIIDCMRKLVKFYPSHIEKEVKHFFIPVMEYFSEEQKDGVPREGRSFDGELPHRDQAGHIS